MTAQTHHHGDTCPGGHWIGSWARAAGESALTGHTIRREHPKGGYVTWCGQRIERPTAELERLAHDCLGCRSRRDA